MQATETNVVVRFLTGDDSGQAARAKAVVDAGDIFISITVLLESERVLRGVHGFTRPGGHAQSFGPREKNPIQVHPAK